MKGTKQTPRQRDWHFGPGWPGKCCGAKTRNGTPCRKAALAGKERCQLHGGRAGAPSGKKNGNYRHGNFRKEAMRKRRGAMARVRALELLGRAVGLFD